jgi:hypothetical protein
MKRLKFVAHPKSAPGDFFVINDQCLSCGFAHVVAHDLIGWNDDPAGISHCIWKKQPETPAELEQAFAAIEGTEAQCYRYAGSDQAIIDKIGEQFCADRVELDSVDPRTIDPQYMSVHEDFDLPWRRARRLLTVSRTARDIYPEAPRFATLDDSGPLGRLIKRILGKG